MIEMIFPSSKLFSFLPNSHRQVWSSILLTFQILIKSNQFTNLNYYLFDGYSMKPLFSFLVAFILFYFQARRCSNVRSWLICDTDSRSEDYIFLYLTFPFSICCLYSSTLSIWRRSSLLLLLFFYNFPLLLSYKGSIVLYKNV